MQVESNDHNLKNENRQLKQIFPMTKNLYQKLKKQNKEKEIRGNNSDTDINILRDQLVSKENTINDLKKIISCLKRKFKSRKSEYNDKIVKLEQENKEKTTEIQNLQKDISFSLQQASQAKNNDEINLREKEQLRITIQNLTEKSKKQEIQFTQKINELKEKNNEKESKIQLQKEQIEALNEENDALKNQIMLMQGQNEDIKAEKDLMYNHTKNLYLQSQNLVEKKEAQIQSLEEELSLFKKQNDSLDINDLFNQIIHSIKNQYKTKLNELKQEIKFKNQVINQQQQCLNDDILNQQLKELKNKYINLKKNFKLKEEEVKNLNDLIEKQKKFIDDKDKMINELKVLFNIDQNKINRLNTEKINLNDEKKNEENSNIKIADLIHSYKMQKIELNELLNELKEINHPLKNELIFIVSEIDEKQNEIMPKMNELIEIIKIKNEENQTLTKELNDRIKELEQESNEQHQIPISKLQQEIEKLKKEIKNLKSANKDQKEELKDSKSLS